MAKFNVGCQAHVLTPAPCSHFDAVSAIQRSIETNHHHRNKNLAATAETFRWTARGCREPPSTILCCTEPPPSVGGDRAGLATTCGRRAPSRTCLAPAGVPERPHARTREGDGFDLGSMRRLRRRLGDPHTHFPAVHIAGTKGKGSTAAFMSNIIRAQGYNVGCYSRYGICCWW
ncbi:uncharacterized protein [Miscanthus floridulus]|uniref:uncharacterized protein n=1 Tax=Miscanthus floridulus TaxID=154761 RepID=UPI00345AFB9D